MIEAQVTEAAANRSRRNRGHARPRPVGYLAERSAAEAALRAAGTLRAGIPAVMVHGEAVARRKDACCGTASGMLLNSGEVVRAAFGPLARDVEARAQLTPSSANGSQRVSVPGTGLTSFLACWWTP